MKPRFKMSPVTRLLGWLKLEFQNWIRQDTVGVARCAVAIAVSGDGTLRQDASFASQIPPGLQVGTAQRAVPTLLALMLIWVAGCAVGPDYHRPAALGTNAVPSQWGDPAITNMGEWKMTQPAADISRGNWWQIYHDPELDRLEALAATNNQQLTLALANLNQARAAAKVAQAGFFPQVSANPSASRQRTSANASPSGNVGGSHTVNTFSAPLDASWELDLFGRLRRLSESAQAQLRASADDLSALQLTIQAEVAMDYFTLSSLEAQADLLHQTVDAYQHAVDVTRSRHRSGVANELDVAQAESQLHSTTAQIPAVDLQRAQTRHALAVLCGQSATTFALNATLINRTNLPTVPLLIPSEWLEQRPDIAATERRMAAANATVGVAQAAFYPRITLNGSGGFQSVSASTLFDWPSRVWAVGPSLQMPLFTGGANRAQLASAKAAYFGSVANYRQIVLTAFQEVEDQLAAQHYLADQLAEESAALTAAAHALNLAQNRYQAGVETYLDVIIAQTAKLTLDRTVIQLEGERWVAHVALTKSLGGGAAEAKP